MDSVPRPPGYAVLRTTQLSRRNRILIGVGIIVFGLGAQAIWTVSQWGHIRQAAGTADVRVPLAAGSMGTLNHGASGVTPGLQRTHVTVRNISGNGSPPNTAASTQRIVIEVLVENTSKFAFTGEPWRLRDTDGHEYAPVPAANILYGSSTPPLADRYALNPGQQIQGVIAFDISANATISWLRYGIAGFGIADLYFDG